MDNNLNSRLTRLQHFYALIFLFVGGYLIFFILSWVIAEIFKLAGLSQNSIDSIIISFLFIFFIFLIIETLLIHIRRLHDQGKSGRYLFFMLVPIMNIVLLYWVWLAPGNNEENIYGKRMKTNIRNLFGIPQKN
jgi:uncharacterized membrane protein YhaH (DUF805 family)